MHPIILCKGGDIIASRKYLRYLKTPAWFEFRKKILERDDWECAWCSRHNCSLHVHHLNYIHIFHEKPSDTITLCKTCHKYGDQIRVLIRDLPSELTEPILKRYGYPFDMKKTNRKHVIRLRNELESLQDQLLSEED